MNRVSDQLARLKALTPPALALFAFPPVVLMAPGLAATLLVAIGVYGITFVIWHDRVPLSRVGAAIAAAAILWLFVKVLPAGGSIGLGLWARLLLLSLCGMGAVALFAGLEPAVHRQASRGLVAGCIVALVLMWIGGPAAFKWAVPWRGGADIGYAASVVAMFPALVWLILDGRKMQAALFGIAALATVAATAPPAGQIAGIAGIIGLATGYAGRRIALYGVAAFTAIAIVVAPLIPMPGAAAAISFNSLRGIGLGAMAPMTEDPVGYGAIHQIWLELGLPGALLFACIAALSLIAKAGRRPSAALCATRTALFAAAATPAILMLGLWPDGWYATLWMAAALSFAGKSS